MESGTVWINSHGGLHPMVPFGGVKSSGYGLEFGVEGLKSVAVTQVVSGQKYVATARTGNGWYRIFCQGTSVYLPATAAVPVPGVNAARVTSAMATAYSIPRADRTLAVGAALTGQIYVVEATYGGWVKVRWNGTRSVWFAPGTYVRQVL